MTDSDFQAKLHDDDDEDSEYTEDERMSPHESSSPAQHALRTERATTYFPVPHEIEEVIDSEIDGREGLEKVASDDSLEYGYAHESTGVTGEEDDDDEDELAMAFGDEDGTADEDGKNVHWFSNMDNGNIFSWFEWLEPSEPGPVTAGGKPGPKPEAALGLMERIGDFGLLLFYPKVEVGKRLKFQGSSLASHSHLIAPSKSTLRY